MSTGTILNNIDICDKQTAKCLIRALEKASKKKDKEITISRTYSEASSAEQIRKIFEKVQ